MARFKIVVLDSRKIGLVNWLLINLWEYLARDFDKCATTEEIIYEYGKEIFDEICKTEICNSGNLVVG